jgi:hypothetical protein
VTGIWPLVSAGSFQAVTGRKTDLWLVKTVGVLVAVIGVVLGWSGLRRGTKPPEILFLAGGSAAGLAVIEAVYALRRRISLIYLLDALGELGLVAAIAHIWWHSRR